MILPTTQARRRWLRWLACACCLSALAACGNDVSSPLAPPHATVVAGDAQSAEQGDVLAQPLVIQALDSHGQPISGATIEWTTEDEGSVAPSTVTTDAQGRAVTAWTLGPGEGLQHAHAAMAGAVVAEFHATATPIQQPPPALPSAFAPVTYDGSGETVHPDYVTMPASWSGNRHFLAITPYPNGNAGWENPSLFAETSPTIWDVPAGASNPLVTPARGYLSDPDAVAVPETNELWLYYRAVDTRNSIFLVRSSDGVSFSEPQLVADAKNHDIVSPTVVRRGPGDWWMWSVNANVGCESSATTVELRRSTDGLTWSAPQTVALNQPGFTPWHIDVQWIASRHQFWAVYNGKTAGNCTTPALFVATSADGVTWHTFPSPILARGVIPEFADIVYRSTFDYDPATDTIDFWYSGARFTGYRWIWRSAYQRRTRREVFATAATKPGPAVAALAVMPSRIPALLSAP